MSKKTNEVNETPKSTAVATPTTPAVPEYLKKFMDQSQTNTDALIASSMSVPRISYRGKRFRFIENGEEELAKELSIKVIILGVDPGAGLFLKTFYETGYQPGSSDPPTCSSSDGIRPDAWVSSPQSQLCRQCPNNVFGSATSIKGGKAKACKDGKRLWVSRLDDPEKYYGLNIPVMSLRNLAEYGKYIAKNKFPLSLVITEIGFDEDSEFPQLSFSHSGFVPEESVEMVTSLALEKPWALPDSMKALPNHEAAPKQIQGQTSKEPEKTPSAPIEEVLESW